MKKNYISTDIHQKQGQELSRKLYRSISEHSKRLDDARSCARNVADLFTTNLQIQRRKLCDYCERLIFSEPLLFGRKSEEVIWRKGYYDVVTTAKKLKKKEFSAAEISDLLTHINAGIGFYHHFLSKLQNEYSLCLKNIIDFPLTLTSESKKTEESPEVLEYVDHCIYQCLIYLGDLNRYRSDICPNWEPTLAIRYYYQAISFKPDYGMPHNQMGTLAMNQNGVIEAVYHYMRCLACKISFEGTKNNLLSLFEKNSKYLEELPDGKVNGSVIPTNKCDSTKHFLARFLLLIDIWYFDKSVPSVYSLCHQTFRDLEECLNNFKANSSENGDSPVGSESAETDSSSSSTSLTNSMIFKVVAICLLCIMKLQAQQSSQLSAVIAFTLAVYSQLIEYVTNHIRESVLNYPLPEANFNLKNRRKKSKLRRRKVVHVDSEESDLSDNDENLNDSESSSDDSFISDAEDILANSSDEDSELPKCSLDDSNEKRATANIENAKTDVTDEPVGAADKEKSTEEIINKVKRMDVNDMLEIISEEGSLASIKILNDWFLNDSEVLKSCGQNTKSLFRQLTFLLNLMNVNIKSSKVSGITINVSEIVGKEAVIPLPEDVTLKGLEILKSSQEALDWSYFSQNNATLKDETIIRLTKFLTFGKTLTSVADVNITYSKKMFTCQFSEGDETQSPTNVMDQLDIQEIENNKILADQEKDEKIKGLTKMQHMGQLWLAAEVRALESRVRGKPSLSPYLVLDADALIKYTYMVKHLVHSRKFIVIVPSAVVSALDDLKREKLEAREAIRWLESQFHRGNRFFRAQRPQEKASIPFIKYPKKKDKEMFVYIQIVECCYYLAEQQKDASNLVTVLIGNHNILINGENKEFSYVGLAKSAGIAIEAITQFYAKWKKTAKGKR